MKERSPVYDWEFSLKKIYIVDIHISEENMFLVLIGYVSVPLSTNKIRFLQGN